MTQQTRKQAPHRRFRLTLDVEGDTLREVASFLAALASKAAAGELDDRTTYANGRGNFAAVLVVDLAAKRGRDHDQALREWVATLSAEERAALLELDTPRVHFREDDGGRLAINGTPLEEIASVEVRGRPLGKGRPGVGVIKVRERADDGWTLATVTKYAEGSPERGPHAFCPEYVWDRSAHPEIKVEPMPLDWKRGELFGCSCLDHPPQVARNPGPFEAMPTPSAAEVLARESGETRPPEVPVRDHELVPPGSVVRDEFGHEYQVAAKCPKCDGCGQIANDDNGSPWSQWQSLPEVSKAAIRAGLVRPLPCPKCDGKGCQ